MHQLWLFCFVKSQRENEEIGSLYSLMFEIVGNKLLKGYKCGVHTRSETTWGSGNIMLERGTAPEVMDAWYSLLEEKQR